MAQQEAEIAHAESCYSGVIPHMMPELCKGNLAAEGLDSVSSVSVLGFMIALLVTFLHGFPALPSAPVW